MLTVIEETDGERVLTVWFHEATIDIELISALDSVLTDVEHRQIENLVLQFGCDALTGDFPSWPPGPRADMRYFARWDAALSRLSRLPAKTFAAYDGRVGPAAVHLGLVVDLRLASAQARLSLGNLAGGRFPGMAAYWLPKFVGLGQARRLFLLGEDLSVEEAARLGLVDVIGDSITAVVADTVKATRPVTPEAACFTRRILDDCYAMEPAATAELAKAARYKLGMTTNDED